MSVQTAAEQVANIVGIEAPASLTGETLDNSRRLKEIAQLAGDDIARRFDWRELNRSTNYTNGSLFDLPVDFDRIPRGAYTFVNGTLVRGPMSDTEWTMIGQNLGTITKRYYRLTQGGKIEFAPAVSGAETAIVIYMTRNWVRRANGDYANTIIADSDAPIFPERLLTKNMIWRWHRQQGLPYQDELNEFEADLTQAAAADRGSHLP